MLRRTSLMRFSVVLISIILSWRGWGESPRVGLEEHELSYKEQNIALAAAYAALGDQDGLRQVLKAGLAQGITVNEYKEILVQVYAYCGFPRSLNALTTLMHVDQEIPPSQKSEGPLPRPLSLQDSLARGTMLQPQLTGAPMQGKLYTFAPALDEFLKAHLFGDIYARDNVSWKLREIATIAMLASRTAVDPQLKTHIRIGKYNGLSDEQVAMILRLAQQAGVAQVLFGQGTENTLLTPYFTGKSYVQVISREGVSISNVTFEPHARSHWHIHHGGGQILLVTAGHGWYQAWGQKPRPLKAGDVVQIPAEVKHWHGAAAHSWFTHLAVAVPAPEANTEWLGPVTDEEYDKLTP